MDKTTKNKNISYILFSTGDFGKLVFENLLKIDFIPLLIVTSIAKRKGRGLKLKDPEIKNLAEKNEIKVIQTENLNEIVKRLKKLKPDFIVAVDYGKKIPNEILKIPKYAPLNIHPSLLPRWRGAAPIERAIMNGDKTIGITIFIMNEKIDQGEILTQTEIPITEGETKGEIEEKIAPICAEKLKETILKFINGEIKPKKQVGKPIYAKKISKEETWINLSKSAFLVARHINALSPKPGAKIILNNKIQVKILKAIPVNINLKEGQIKIEKNRLFLGCKEGAIEILKIQPQNKKIMSAKDFICGYQRFLI